MAFTPANLVLVQNAGRNRQFTYDTPDARATTIASGYFNAAAGQFNKGDIIFARSVTGGTEVVDILRITSASGATTVTVGATALT